MNLNFLLFASEVLCKVEPGHCTFVSSAGSYFMHTNQMGHSNIVQGSEHAVIFIHFNTSLVRE